MWFFRCVRGRKKLVRRREKRLPTEGSRYLLDYLVYELSFVQASVSEGY